jgi:hypothetical protein
VVSTIPSNPNRENLHPVLVFLTLKPLLRKILEVSA